MTPKERHTFEEHWNQIIQWYDFDKVKKTMDALEWEWNKVGIPSTAQIVEKARSLCEEVYRKRGARIGTGGFKAYYDAEEDIMSLEFTVEDWNTEYFDET